MRQHDTENVGVAATAVSWWLQLVLVAKGWPLLLNSNTCYFSQLLYNVTGLGHLDMYKSSPRLSLPQVWQTNGSHPGLVRRPLVRYGTTSGHRRAAATTQRRTELAL